MQATVKLGVLGELSLHHILGVFVLGGGGGGGRMWWRGVDNDGDFFFFY